MNPWGKQYPGRPKGRLASLVSHPLTISNYFWKITSAIQVVDGGARTAEIMKSIPRSNAQAFIDELSKVRSSLSHYHDIRGLRLFAE